MRRFSIRDLFWLTLVVAMGVGWWVDREQVAASAADARHNYAFVAGALQDAVNELKHLRQAGEHSYHTGGRATE